MLLAKPLHAHSGALAAGQLLLDAAGHGELRLELGAADLWELRGRSHDPPAAAAMPGQGSGADENAVGMAGVGERLAGYWRVHGDGRRCHLRAASLAPGPGGRFVLTWQVECTALPEILQVDYGLGGASALDLQVTLGIAVPGNDTHRVWLSRRAPRAVLRLRAPPAGETFASFGWQGLWHVLLGWDHVAFLVALVCGLASPRRVLAALTAFTAAHAITLVLVAGGAVDAPSGWVEPLIAASIAAAAALAWRRLRLAPSARRAATRSRAAAVVAWLAIFATGLVHGLGFASPLRDLLHDQILLAGLPGTGARLLASADPAVPARWAEGAGWALASFHLGIEAGQAALVALAWPARTHLARHPRGRVALERLLAGLVVLGAAIASARAVG